MTYAEATAFLYGLRRFGWRPGLATIERLLALLGDPHAGIPSIHVGGTNGKGSTAAMLDAIFRAAGYRTGLYTSPHLLSFTERIRVDGEPIGEAEIVALTEELKTLCAAHFAPETTRRRASRLPHPTFFELTTAMAFLHFRRRAVDAAVDRGRTRRSARRHQRDPAVGGGDHEHRPGARAVSRAHAGGDRRGESGYRQGEGPDRHRGARGCPGGDPAAGCAFSQLPSFSRRKRIAGRCENRVSRARPSTSKVPGVATTRFASRCAGRHQVENAVLAVAAAEAAQEQGLRWMRWRSVAGWRKSPGPGVCRS